MYSQKNASIFPAVRLFSEVLAEVLQRNQRAKKIYNILIVRSNENGENI